MERILSGYLVLAQTHAHMQLPWPYNIQCTYAPDELKDLWYDEKVKLTSDSDVLIFALAFFYFLFLDGDIVFFLYWFIQINFIACYFLSQYFNQC